MPYKDRERARNYRKEHYLKNRDKELARQKVRKAEKAKVRLAIREEYQRTHQIEIHARIQAKRDKRLLTSRNWKLAHVAEMRSYHHNRLVTLKTEAFIAYGGVVCSCCGDTHIEFLTLDHIGGDGAEHRKRIGNIQGSAFYAYLKKQGYPIGLRVLCFNCNLSLGFHGYCPHGNIKIEPERAITKNAVEDSGRPQLSLL